MKKLFLILSLVVCINCRPLTSSEAGNFIYEPSMTKLSNLNWNNLCFNVVDYKDERNYKLDINVDNEKNLYVDIKDNEIRRIRYDGIERSFLTMQDVLYYVRQKAR